MSIITGKRVLARAIVGALGFAVSQASIAANNIEINSGLPVDNVNIDELSPGDFTSTDDSATLKDGSITSAWSNGDAVSITTTTSGQDLQAGDITVNTVLDFNGYGSSSLSLNALNDININFDILDSDANTADTLTLDLSPTGVVNLNASIGQYTTATINGALAINDTGTYNLINATDSLTVDSITKTTLGVFNYSAGSLTLNSGLNIGVSGLLGDAVTLGATQNLQTSDQNIAAAATLTQNGGNNVITNVLLLADGGSYNLNAGALSAGSVVNGGTLSNAAEMNVTGSLSIEGTGSYSQSGNLNVDSIGVDGAFTQTAGNTVITNALAVNVGGMYEQSGNLTAGSISAGGALVQTAGDTVVTGAVAISDTGSYALSGGTLTADDITRTLSGVFSYTGGDLTLNSGALAIETDGLLGDTLTLDASQKLHTASQSVGTVALASGTVTQSAGTNTVDTALTINTGGAYNLNGGSLAAGSVSIDGGLNQSSGIHTVAGGLVVTSLGTYNLGGGTLSSGSLTTDGAFVQSDGANIVSGALMVEALGSYTLSGGSLTADTLDNSGAFTWSNGNLTLNNDDLVVDDTGAGLVGSSLTLSSTKNLHTVNQTVGTSVAGSGSVTQRLSSNNKVDSVLTINAGGSYGSTSGTLTAGSVVNEGVFTQAGSAITNITTTLTLGAGSSYNQNGGNITAGSINNAGTYNQSLGNNTVSGVLMVDAGGAYNLSDGALTANSIDNNGAMIQSGGSNSVATSLTINTGGSYALNAGTLSTGSISNNGMLTTAGIVSADDITVGTADPASGSVSQTAGNTSVTNALTINAGGNYSLSGGNLSANSINNSGAISQSNNADINVSTLTMSTGSTLDLSGSFRSCSDCTRLSTTTIDNSGAITQTGAITSSSILTINSGGSYDQSTGYNFVSGLLTVDAGSSYALSGSDNYSDANYSYLSANSIDNNGTFTQNGGFNIISNTMTIATDGSYAMSAGTLRVGEIIRTGSGAFVYTGGELLLTNSDLIVDGTSDSLLGSTVTIANGQAFQAVNQNIGSTGSITQTGGLNTATNMLTIDAGGSYTLSGGTLRTDDVALNGGAFNYTAGSVQLANGDLNVGDSGFIGNSLNIVDGESFKASNQTVDGAGSVVQDGGSNNITALLTIDSGGSYTMNGGNLIAGSISNNGSFNYNAGGVRLTNSDLEISSAGPLGDIINIIDGQSFGSVNQTVGTAFTGSGSINQTGGSNTVDNVLTINSGGAYTMSGGSLVAGSVVNNGVFDYSGGAVRLTNDDLAIDSAGLLGADINISNYQTFGSVNQSIGASLVGSGSITQNGGHNVINNVLTVGAGGTYNLSGSTYSQSGNYSTLRVGQSGIGQMNVAGVVNQSGARAMLTALTINDGGTYAQSSGINQVSSVLTIETGGSYQLSGGSLTASSIVKDGVFTFTGGSLNLGSDLVIATGELLGDNVSIDSSKSLRVDGGNSINVASGSSLLLNGGSIRTSTISNSGTFTFESGNLAVNSLTVAGSGLLGNSVALSSGRVLETGSVTVNNGSELTVISGSGNEVDSLLNNGTVSVTGGRLNVNDVTNNGAVNIASGASMSWRSGNNSAIAMNSFIQNNGATTIDGTLLATTVSIEGGVLNGSGTIVGDVAVSSGGKINPGNSLGDLEIAGDLTLDANGRLMFEVGDDPSNIGEFMWDKIIAESYDLTSGKVEFSLLDSVDVNIFTASFSLDDFIRIGDRSENFGYLEYGLDLASLSNINFRAYDEAAAQWSNLILDSNGSFSISAVPVPAAVWLFGSGLLGLIAVARRRAS